MATGFIPRCSIPACKCSRPHCRKTEPGPAGNGSISPAESRASDFWRGRMRGSSATASFARASSLGTEFLEADIRLLDEDGCVACELLGFRVKLVSAEIGSRGARESRRLALRRHLGGEAARRLRESQWFGAAFLVHPCRSRRCWTGACRPSSVAGTELHRRKSG